MSHIPEEGKMPGADPLKIDYQIAFDDGEVVEVAVRLDPDTLALTPDSSFSPPPWTAMSCNRCPVCSVSADSAERCPIAVNMSGLVKRFSQRFSYDPIEMVVTTDERTISASTTLQAALSSLTGIFMVTSGCPVMDLLRPMVRFHLPLATEHETIYRASSMYLLGQFFRAQQGKPSDWCMKGLDRMYRDVHEVNRAFARRIREAAEHDANANALVRLDLFTDGVSESTRASLADLKYLFAGWDLPASDVAAAALSASELAPQSPMASTKVAEGSEGPTAINRSAEAFPFLVRHSSDIVMLFSADMVVRYVSPATQRLLGRPAEEFLGGSPLVWVHPEDVPTAEQKFAQTIARPGVASPVELRIKHASGAWIWFEAVANNCLSDPSLNGIVVSARDISDRKQLEANLLQTDRMASMGVLAASVAHDINNALATVLANQDFLDEELTELRASCVDPDVARHLRSALDALGDAANGARQIRNIARDLKTFSRVDDDHVELVDIRHAIETAINLAWTEIRHRARLVKQYSEVPYVAATEAHLVQVFLNLLVNAAQAITSGSVDANQIRVVTSTSESGDVVVEVHDTGDGIPVEVLGRLFEPFFTTKSVGVGTGLGLSISRSIVRKLGGEISVKSGSDGGSTFSVRLPAGPPATCSVGPEQATAHDEAPARIMVIDDEPMMGTVIQRLLGHKHQVVSVLSGAEALRLLESDGCFDAVLCDVMMPEMPAWALFERMERQAPTIARRMIFITSGAFTEQAHAFLRSVSNPCLDKPLDANSLRRSLRIVSAGQIPSSHCKEGTDDHAQLDPRTSGAS